MPKEYHRRVTSVTPVPHGEETTSALLTGATLIPLADSGDFGEHGGHVRILGEIYAYSTMDEGDVSGVPSITLDSGLLDDVPAESIVYEWNDVKGEVVTDWVATVTDEIDASTNTAYLTHALIALIASGIALVGESVTVRADDDGTWWLTEVHGATPGYDPGFIRTGGLGADTVVWAGTENGRRAQLDGIDGALEAFNDANEQTVNIDGEANYIEGTLATAASGARVEIGPGQFASFPANQVRLYTDADDEVTPGLLNSFTAEFIGEEFGVLQLRAHEWTNGTATEPFLSLNTQTPSGSLPSRATLEASEINLNGTVNAVMGDGSVGTGAFRTSVDARVTAGVPDASTTVKGRVELATSAETTTGTDTVRATTPAGVAAAIAALPAASETVAGKAEIATQAETDTGTDDARIVTPLKMATRLAAYAQPLDNNLSEIAATSPVADRMLYHNGTDWVLTTLTSTARAILDDTDIATVRATILAKDKRPAVNAQSGTTYTIVLTDEDKVVQFTSASAVALTVPTNATTAFAIGTVIQVVQLGAGVVTVGGAGVTFNSLNGLLATAGAGAVINLRKRLSDTWVVWGDLA